MWRDVPSSSSLKRYLSVPERVWIKKYIYIHTYTHIYMHTSIHTHIHVSMCACIYMHICMHIYMHICMHVYTHTYMDIQTHTFINMYISSVGLNCPACYHKIKFDQRCIKAFLARKIKKFWNFWCQFYKHFNLFNNFRSQLVKKSWWF